jgi:Flp pilus assembly protein TadD
MPQRHERTTSAQLVQYYRDSTNPIMAKSSKSKQGSGKAFAVVVGLVVIVAAGATALALTSSEPADPQVHLAKAKEWIAKGDGNSAVIELRTALQVDPDHKASRLTLIKLYLSAGQGALAQAEIDRLRGLGDSEEVLEPLELRALLLQRQFQQLVGRLVTRPGLESSAELLRLLAAAQIGLGKEDAARRSYQDALGVDPTDARARTGFS